MRKSATAAAAFLLLAAPQALAVEAGTPPATAAASAANPSAASAATPAPPSSGLTTGAITAAPEAGEAVLREVRTAAESLPRVSDTHEQKDREALAAFYQARTGEGLWTTASGFKPEAEALAALLRGSAAYGLDPAAFRIPDFTAAGSELSATRLADAELQLSTAALLYVRHARGGRIAEPARQLNSNLDRRPQWIEPAAALDALAKAEDKAAYLLSLQPQHPQFEKLRQLYVAALPKDGSTKALSPAAKRLRANMEMWRWMWPDMGELHVLNNIPEFMQHVYRDGKVIRSAKIVAGRIDMQSSVFSRPLKYVVLRPQWRVPESIKVNELWPSLLRGGGYMRQYGLQLETKAGKAIDWRTVDWVKTDIRNYEVTQPPGPRSVLGHVKFSFPSQHTIFMHDTPDKWMFRQGQRTLSHGCLRVDKPMELAEIILAYDKGWDKAKIAELDRAGPLDNEVSLSKEVPVHLVYFTAWVSDDGRLKIFPDVYGHEKRVTQALDGNWDAIAKGRNHLAPVANEFDPATVAARPRPQIRMAPRRASSGSSLSDVFSSAFSLD